MSAASLSSPGLRKELHAILPLWGLCIGAVIVGAIVQKDLLLVAAALAGSLGPAALSAQTFGHDYTYRTLGLQLSLPRRRRTLLLEKYAVLVPLGFMLLGVAWWMIFRNESFMRLSGWDDFPAPVYAGMCAMFLAPWLTLWARNVVGATIFSFALPATLLVAGDVIGLLVYGWRVAEVDRLKFTMFIWGTAVLSIVGAVAGWRAFLRLQVIDGTGDAFHMPRILRRRESASRRHPVVAMVGKELRLQQLTFAVLGVYLVMWIVTAVVRAAGGAPTSLHAFRDFTIMFTLLLALIIGAVPSADERHLGTLDSQLLLPMSAGRQWLLKAGTALGLALLLAIAVVIASLVQRRRLPSAFWYQFPIMIAALTSVALYLSSLTTSAVRAVIATLPTFILGMTFFRGLFWFAEMMSRTILFRELFEGSRILVSVRTYALATDLAFAVLGIAVVPIALWGAFENHRALDRSRWRVFRHVAVFLTVVALWTLAWLAMIAILEVPLRRRI